MNLGLYRTAAALAVAYLLITAFQGPAASSKAASFTLKLGLAILIADLVRGRAGLLDAWHGIWGSDDPPFTIHFLINVSYSMSVYIAPACFFAATLTKSYPRRAVALAGLVGVSAPVAGVLIFANFIGGVHFHSPMSSVSSILALFLAGDPISFRWKCMIGAVTVFAVARLGIGAMSEVGTR